jgi:hypothetical protein
MTTQKKYNFEGALFEDQDMSEINKSKKTEPSISMSSILQRVKRIHRMLEIPFLKKQDSDDQLPFKETPILLHTGHSETNEQKSFLMDQDCPTFPVIGEDIDEGDFPDDTSDTSEDSDEDCYPPQRKSNFIEGHCYRTVCRKVRKLELGLETGVTGASPPTVTSMESSFYLGGQVQGRRP